jgi:hypothetical protein
MPFVIPKPHEFVPVRTEDSMFIYVFLISTEDSMLNQ